MITKIDHVQQRRTGYGRGQCTEACIASLLRVPLDAVPDLWAGPHVPADAPPEAHQPPERMAALIDWLGALGWVIVEWDIGAGLVGRAPVRPEGAPDWLGLDGYHMIGGKTAGGVGHFVVGLGGLVAWNPNPDGVDLVSSDRVWWLVRRDDVPEDLRHHTTLSLQAEYPECPP